MNFFRPRVIVLIVVPNNVQDVGIQQSPSDPHNLLPLVFRSGLDLKENICVDG